jgi:lysine 2,3-aminomutase
VQDVVLSGGDSYYLLPHQLRYIGDRLLDIPHVRRFRIATKGLCVSPSRTLGRPGFASFLPQRSCSHFIDPEDTWTAELIRLSNRGKERGKQVAMHTHFNHEQEWSWINREAAQKLFQNGVMVRNQSVLLRGVNDNVHTMSRLIRTLADNNIQPVGLHFPHFCFQGLSSP